MRLAAGGCWMQFMQHLEYITNWNYSNKPVKFALSCFTHSILTCYLISLALALISKTTHENIGFEKLQQIINLVPWECFFSQDFSILYGNIQKLILDENHARRDFLKKDLNKLFFVEDFPNHLMMNGQTTLSQGCQGFYKQVNRLWISVCFIYLLL